MQRERPVIPEQSHCGMASALEAAQRSFESACDRPQADFHFPNSSPRSGRSPLIQTQAEIAQVTRRVLG